MKVLFNVVQSAPERLMCEAGIVFEEGPLAGMKLVGISVWKSPDGELYVTFPARAFGVGGDRKYFDFLRTVDGTAAAARAVKTWLLEEYEAWQFQQRVATTEHAR